MYASSSHHHHHHQQQQQPPASAPPSTHMTYHHPTHGTWYPTGSQQQQQQGSAAAVLSPSPQQQSSAGHPHLHHQETVATLVQQQQQQPVFHHAPQSHQHHATPYQPQHRHHLAGQPLQEPRHNQSQQQQQQQPPPLVMDMTPGDHYEAALAAYGAVMARELDRRLESCMAMYTRYTAEVEQRLAGWIAHMERRMDDQQRQINELRANFGESMQQEQEQQQTLTHQLVHLDHSVLDAATRLANLKDVLQLTPTIGESVATTAAQTVGSTTERPSPTVSDVSSAAVAAQQQRQQHQEEEEDEDGNKKEEESSDLLSFGDVVVKASSKLSSLVQRPKGEQDVENDEGEEDDDDDDNDDGGDDDGDDSDHQEGEEVGEDDQEEAEVFEKPKHADAVHGDTAHQEKTGTANSPQLLLPIDRDWLAARLNPWLEKLGAEFLTSIVDVIRSMPEDRDVAQLLLESLASDDTVQALVQDVVKRRNEDRHGAATARVQPQAFALVQSLPSANNGAQEQASPPPPRQLPPATQFFREKIQPEMSGEVIEGTGRIMYVHKSMLPTEQYFSVVIHDRDGVVVVYFDTWEPNVHYHVDDLLHLRFCEGPTPSDVRTGRYVATYVKFIERPKRYELRGIVDAHPTANQQQLITVRLQDTLQRVGDVPKHAPTIIRIHPRLFLTAAMRDNKLRRGTSVKCVATLVSYDEARREWHWLAKRAVLENEVLIQPPPINALFVRKPSGDAQYVARYFSGDPAPSGEQQQQQQQQGGGGGGGGGPSGRSHHPTRTYFDVVPRKLGGAGY